MAILYKRFGHKKDLDPAVRRRGGLDPVRYAIVKGALRLARRRSAYMKCAIADTTTVLNLIDSQNEAPERVSSYFLTEIQPQSQATIASGIQHAYLTPRRFSTATEFASA